VWNERGLRFVVYYNLPNHVHGQKAGGEAKINLGDSTTKPSLLTVRKMSLGEVEIALEIAAKEQTRLLNAWRQIHGKGEDD
jgi:hypothetical protein